MSKPHYDGSLCFHGCAGMIGFGGGGRHLFGGVGGRGLCACAGGGGGVAGGIPLTFGLV